MRVFRIHFQIFDLVVECQGLSEIMFKLEKKSFSSVVPPVGKIYRLIFGRLALILPLLLASWWWTSSYLHISDEILPSRFFLFLLVSIFLTIVYFFFLRLDKNFLWQIRIQFLIDIFLITWFVRETGDTTSPYIALYIVLISVAGVFFGTLETVFVTALCAASYTLLSILSAQSLIYSFSGEAPPSRVLQIIAFNNVAILIVGLLSARLSERRRVREQLRETTENLRETEANFSDLHALHERIVESIGSGLVTTDLEGKIYKFNRAAEEISGLQSGETIGQSIFSLFGEELRAPVNLCLGAVESAECSIEHFEAEIQATQGGGENQRRVAVVCSVSSLVGKTGNIYGLIFTFQDLTQIRAMEETLRRSDRLAAVGRMAAGLAHEIRNPLGSMSAALQFIQQKVPIDTPEASLMDVVLNESDRLNKIITNFLTYARSSADGFSKDNFSPTDVGEAIRDCLVLLRHSPEVKATHLLESDLPDAPVNIRANETQIKQVFWNLLQNSIQAMPDGGKLNVRLNESPGKNIQIVFEDTGGGISPEYLENMFEPFSSEARGTGLGLSIVHKIVRDHGGRIDVQSAVGEGTKITVELPQ
jgi:two-component system sensor histidine kinase PilS (NtrC family)